MDEEEYEIVLENFIMDDNEGVYLSSSELRWRIDYVLVFEICEENEEVSE